MRVPSRPHLRSSCYRPAPAAGPTRYGPAVSSKVRAPDRTVAHSWRVHEDPFESCWGRIDRLAVHRKALAGIWNAFIEDHPFAFELRHDGGGVHVLVVDQLKPIPPEFALVVGEWLYNARACLDHIIWATASYTTGQCPPPDEGTLQYPVYGSFKAWKQNLYRLKHLADHHRTMLFTMQPFNSDADANYLGVVNDLARIDRHRRLTVSTTYLRDLQPVIQLPEGLGATLEWGDRVLTDGQAEVARITVAPWSDGTPVAVNPRIGIDPEVTEWTRSAFWQRVEFAERLIMIEIFLKAEIAAYEYDCTGAGRKADMLTETYRAECDARGRPGPIERTVASAPAWGTPQVPAPSTEERFRGEDFPRGAYRPASRRAQD